MILTKKNDLKEKQKEISVIYIYIYSHNSICEQCDSHFIIYGS